MVRHERPAQLDRVDFPKAAEISRPALYLLFRNKTDIYRAIASEFLDASLRQAAEAFAAKGSFADRAMKAIEDALIDKMRHIADSPHGAELMDMKNSLAGDIAARWRECFAWHLCGAIDAEASNSGVDLEARGLSPHMLADMLLDGLEGVKARVREPAGQREAARALVRVVERAIAP